MVNMHEKPYKQHTWNMFGKCNNLREILINNEQQTADSMFTLLEDSFMNELVKYCTIVVSTVPILIVYPFLQKYFEKGVMIGAVKE